MPFRIEYSNGETCPVARCEECDSRITDASLGMVAWDCDGRPYTLHKEKCSFAFEERNVPSHRSFDRFPWMGMDKFVPFLGWNAGIRHDSMRSMVDEASI